MGRHVQTNFTADSFTGKGEAAAPEPPQAEAESEQPAEAPVKAPTKKAAKKAADKK
jgi:hypothetical protein